jgi:hypothetical protein
LQVIAFIPELFLSQICVVFCSIVLAFAARDDEEEPEDISLNQDIFIKGDDY